MSRRRHWRWWGWQLEKEVLTVVMARFKHLDTNDLSKAGGHSLRPGGVELTARSKGASHTC